MKLGLKGEIYIHLMLSEIDTASKEFMTNN